MLLDGITGVGRTAAAMIAELGVDVSRFPSDDHPTSWAGVCPGNKQRGGKRLRGQMARGNRRGEARRMRAALGEPD